MTALVQVYSTCIDRVRECMIWKRFLSGEVQNISHTVRGDYGSPPWRFKQGVYLQELTVCVRTENKPQFRREIAWEQAIVLTTCTSTPSDLPFRYRYSLNDPYISKLSRTDRQRCRPLSNNQAYSLLGSRTSENRSYLCWGFVEL